MNRSEHYHVAIVVPDLMAGRAHYADLLGLAWGPVMEFDGDFIDGAGNERVLHLKACYSSVAPYLELIEEMRGTEWECNEYSNIHHIGFWSDDVEADSARWSTAGCPLALGSRESGVMQMAYHRDPFGVRLEIVHEAQREMIEQIMCAPATDTSPMPMEFG